MKALWIRRKDCNAICSLEECRKGFNFCWRSKANVEPKSEPQKKDFWGGTTRKRGIFSCFSDKRPNRSQLRGAPTTEMALGPALLKSVLEYYYEYQEANGPPLEDELVRAWVRAKCVFFLQHGLHIEIHIKQYCKIMFYVFTQALQIHCLPKIREMDLEETWQKEQKSFACLR